MEGHNFHHLVLMHKLLSHRDLDSNLVQDYTMMNLKILLLMAWLMMMRMQVSSLVPQVSMTLRTTILLMLLVTLLL